MVKLNGLKLTTGDSKNEKVASLRYGVIFKKTFSDPQIFMAFVKDLVEAKLEINNVETEKSFDPPIGSVKVEFDLFAQDLKNRIFVNIQDSAEKRWEFWTDSLNIENVG